MINKLLFIIKKRKMKKIILNSKTVNNIDSLLKLLNNNVLDNYIIRLDKKKVKLKIYTENKKKLHISYLFEDMDNYLNLPNYKNNLSGTDYIYNMYEMQYKNIIFKYNKNSDEIKLVSKYL